MCSTCSTVMRIIEKNTGWPLVQGGWECKNGPYGEEYEGPPKNLKIELPSDPGIPLRGRDPQESSKLLGGRMADSEPGDPDSSSGCDTYLGL